MTAGQTNRVMTRLRHAHEVHKIESLLETMLASGSVCLQVEKVFADLARLKDFTFLEELSVRQLKRGIAAVGSLKKLTKLSLWEITKLNFGFIEDLSALEHLHCYAVKFANFALPTAPSSLRHITFRVCNGFGGKLDLSSCEQLQDLNIEDCGHLSEIVGCSQLKQLSRVNLSNIRDLSSLAGIASAPNLKSVIVQLTPNLPIAELEWMLTHPTLENVFPLLDSNEKSPLMQQVIELLEPKFGDGLLKHPSHWAS